MGVGGGGSSNPTHCSTCAGKHRHKFEKGFTGGRKRQLLPFVTYTYLLGGNRKAAWTCPFGSLHRVDIVPCPQSVFLYNF